MAEEREPTQPEPDPEPEQSVEDLDVPEEESEDVKGGTFNFSKIEYDYKSQ